MRRSMHFYFCCLFFTTACAFAQSTGTNVLKDICERLRTNASYHYDVTVQSFAAGSPSVSAGVINCVTLKHNDHYYLNMIGKTTIVTGKYSLLIDERQRLIMYRGYTSKPEDFQQQDPSTLFNLDTLLKINQAKITVLKNDADQSVLKVSNAGNNISEMKMVFDKKENILRKVEYWYDKEGQKETGTSLVAISYKKAKVAIGESVFSLQNYIYKQKGNWVPQKKYQNYKIVDQSNLSF